jgi:Zn ribbon nucleic-acid-binding protein
MKKLFVCPKCGSTDAKTPMIYEGGVGRLQPNIDIRKCGDCGYQGPFLKINEDELEEVKKKIKKVEEE